jgi:hypothetical protein
MIIKRSNNRKYFGKDINFNDDPAYHSVKKYISSIDRKPKTAKNIIFKKIYMKSLHYDLVIYFTDSEFIIFCVS